MEDPLEIVLAGSSDTAAAGQPRRTQDIQMNDVASIDVGMFRRCPCERAYSKGTAGAQ